MISILLREANGDTITPDGFLDELKTDYINFKAQS